LGRMDLPTLLLIAVGLAMDCFAVSLAAGAKAGGEQPRTAILLGCAFGGFQAAMTLAGWAAGESVITLISGVDHWIAFGLLLLIGMKIIREGIACGEEAPVSVRAVPLLLLSIATSIDALAIGVGFAFLSVDIVPAAAIIGLVSFAFAVAGVQAGGRLYGFLGRKMEVLGGLILIGIGMRVLLYHLGLI
jgi:putative Mn2+ efflux pump MntP